MAKAKNANVAKKVKKFVKEYAKEIKAAAKEIDKETIKSAIKVGARATRQIAHNIQQEVKPAMSPLPVEPARYAIPVDRYGRPIRNLRPVQSYPESTVFNKEGDIITQDRATFFRKPKVSQHPATMGEGMEFGWGGF